jgi:hypothetical protein
VLGHSRPAHGNLAGELADRARAPAEELEDVPPRRVAERVEGMSVS